MVVIALALLSAGASMAEVTMEATANRQRIYIGESFILQVKISGSDRPVEPDVSGIADAEVRLLDSREYSNFSVIIINGRMERQGFVGRVISYEVTPRHAGTFRAGPIRLEVDGRHLEAAGPEVEVTDVTPQSDVQLGVEVSRETALVDEPFTVRLYLRIRALPGDFAKWDPLFPDNPPLLQASFLDAAPIDGLHGPSMQNVMQKMLAQHDRQPGIHINEYVQRSDPFRSDPFSFGFFEPFGRTRRARFVLPRSMVEVDGQQFFEYRLELQYTPKEEGDYVFGPVTFKGVIPVSVDAAGNADGRDVFAVGRAATVRVVPPPEAGRPASFTGALGTNLHVAASLDCLTCNVGDPVRLTLTVAGDLRFDRMFPPKLETQTNLLENFSVYDQTVQTLTDSPTQRRFVYTIRPHHAGMLEVPPLEVAYYDTAERKYVVRQTAPAPLDVRPGAEVTAEQIIGATAVVNGVAPEVADAEMSPAKPWLMADGADSDNYLCRPWLWVVVAAGPIVYIIVLAGQQYFVWRRQTAPGRRRRHDLVKARRRLRRLQRRNAPPGEEIGMAIRGAVRAALAVRCCSNTASLTPNELEAMLERAKLPEADARILAAIYQRYFDASYLGASAVPNSIAADELRRDCRDLERILGDL